MKLYLGVDSGGTKTKFLLVDEQGKKLAQSTQKPSHYLQVGLVGLKQVMQSGLDDCLSQINVHKEDIQHIFVSVAGYSDIEDDNQLIINSVNEVFNPIKTTIGNDVDNAYAGALSTQAGIVVIAGTGSIGLGKDSKGNIYRCGGWHHSFGGDEGSAFWIGSKLILEFTCQSDGRSEKTQLYEYMKEKYNFETDSDILQMVIVDWGFDRTKVASLAHDVHKLAILGDVKAIEIYELAAFEISRIIIAIKKKLEFEGKVIASYQGGVFRSGKYVTVPLKEILERQNIELVSPLLSPDEGSALLALKYADIQITQTILDNLK